METPSKEPTDIINHSGLSLELYDKSRYVHLLIAFFSFGGLCWFASLLQYLTIEMIPTRSLSGEIIFLFIVYVPFFWISRYCQRLLSYKKPLPLVERRIYNLLKACKVTTLGENGSIVFSLMRHLITTTLILLTVLAFTFSFTGLNLDPWYHPTKFYELLDQTLFVMWVLVILDIVLSLLVARKNEPILSLAIIAGPLLFINITLIVPLLPPLLLDNLRSIQNNAHWGFFVSIIIFVLISVIVFWRKSPVKNTIRYVLFPLVFISVSTSLLAYMLFKTPYADALVKERETQIISLFGKEKTFNPGTFIRGVEGGKEVFLEAAAGQNPLQYWLASGALLNNAKRQPQRILDVLATIGLRGNFILSEKQAHIEQVETKDVFLADKLGMLGYRMKYLFANFPIERKMLEAVLAENHQLFLDLYLKHYLNREQQPSVFNDDRIDMPLSTDLQVIANIIIQAGWGRLPPEQIKRLPLREKFVNSVNKAAAIYEGSQHEGEFSPAEIAVIIDWFQPIPPVKIKE